MNYLYISHILAGLFFIYMGLYKTKKKDILYNILVILSVIIIAYHGYRLVSKLNRNISNISYVNLFHILLLAPLLLYVGLVKGKGIYPSNELLLVLGSGIVVLFVLKLANLN